MLWSELNTDEFTQAGVLRTVCEAGRENSLEAFAIVQAER